MVNILITGEAGFNGSNFERHMLDIYTDYNESEPAGVSCLLTGVSG